MANENIGGPDQPEADPQAGGTSSPIESHQPGNNGNKRYSDGRILAINLIILVVYTGLCALTSGGPFFDAFLLFVHVMFCFVAALTYKRWSWALSGLAVLLIGVSTCVGVLFNVSGLQI
jgi:hypothetical protein